MKWLDQTLNSLLWHPLSNGPTGISVVRIAERPLAFLDCKFYHYWNLSFLSSALCWLSQLSPRRFPNLSALANSPLPRKSPFLPRILVRYPKTISSLLYSAQCILSPVYLPISPESAIIHHWTLHYSHRTRHSSLFTSMPNSRQNVNARP